MNERRPNGILIHILFLSHKSLKVEMRNIDDLMAGIHPAGTPVDKR